MTNSLEDQAIRPRGNTTREKLQFMVNWYEKASKNDANDPYQRSFLDATGDWVAAGQRLLENADDKLHEAIQAHIQDIKTQKNNELSWMKNGMTRQYILIELPRTLVP
jgi:formate dehydrogenase maturation protein FdhE